MKRNAFAASLAFGLVVFAGAAPRADALLVKKVAKKVGGAAKKVGSVVKKVAPMVGKLAAFIPGPAGMIAGVAAQLASGGLKGGIKGVLSNVAQGALGKMGGIGGIIGKFAGKAGAGGKGGGIFSFIGQASKGKLGFGGVFKQLGIDGVQGGGLLNKARGIMARLHEINPKGLGKVGEFMSRIKGKFGDTFGRVTKGLTDRLAKIKALLPPDKQGLVDQVAKETTADIGAAQEEAQATVVTQQAAGELPEAEQKAADADSGAPAGTDKEGAPSPDVPATEPQTAEAPAAK